MAWATPRTWVTGDDITAARLNQDLRDNPLFLYNAAACRAYNSATQVMGNSSFTALTFDSERKDSSGSMHSTSSNTGRLVAPVAGFYHAGGCITFGASSTATRATLVRVNGLTYVGGLTVLARTDGAGTAVPIHTMYQLAAADYVEIVGYQNSGGSLNSLVDVNNAPEGYLAFAAA